MPIYVIVQPELPEAYAVRRRAMETPTPHMIFGDVNRRRRPNHHVVQRDRNGSSDLIAATNPCDPDRQQRLERIKRREAKEDPDSRTEGDGVRRVRDRHQRHVMRDQPALQSRQRSGQARLVNRLRHLL